LIKSVRGMWGQGDVCLFIYLFFFVHTVSGLMQHNLLRTTL